MIVTEDAAAGRQLIETYRGAVYPWHCDHMGHMNVMWYVGKFDEATWNFFAHIGLAPSLLCGSARGMAAVDQRIAYLSELHAGDTVAVRSGAVEVGAKFIKFFHEMRNGETSAVAAVTMLTAVHIDTNARRSTPLPDEIVERARRCTADYKLPW
jgi:acyl-CoA thioester hydrolase